MSQYATVECVGCGAELIGNPANQKLGFECIDCRNKPKVCECGKPAGHTGRHRKAAATQAKPAAGALEFMDEFDARAEATQEMLHGCSVPVEWRGEATAEPLLEKLIDRMLAATDWTRVPVPIKRGLVEQILDGGLL